MKQRTADSKVAVEDIPVVLESAINGSTTKKKNPHAPETVQTGDPITIHADGTVEVG